MHGRSELPQCRTFEHAAFSSLVALGLLSLTPWSPGVAQEPVRPDTTTLDTSRVRQLPEINVTRTAEPLQRVPYAVGVVDRTSGRSGNVSGTLSLSQFKVDGFRQHSAAEFRQLNGALDYAVGGSTLATLRLSLADNPRGQNPGALTRTEYLLNPDSAAANNIRRGADKDAQQHQLALRLRHFDAGGNEYEATVLGDRTV